MKEDRKQGHGIEIPRPRKPDPNRPLSRYGDKEIDGVIKGLLTAQKTDQREIGKFLHERKQLLGHGKWMAWLGENFVDDFSDKKSHQTAENYIDLYQRCPKEIVPLIPLRLLYRITKKSFPDKLRQSLYDKAESLKPGIDIKEINEAVDAARKEEFDPEHPATRKLLLAHEKREARAEQIMQVENTFKHWRKLWNPLVAALAEGLPLHCTLDGLPLITREQADNDLVKDLEKYGLMPPYKVFDEDD
jgi:hypothetical protein